MTLQGFMSRHSVFTHDEFVHASHDRRSDNPNTLKATLAYYKDTGKILALRRGLYAVVPPDTNPRSLVPDPYLVAAKMADDAVLAYHTALDFHGIGHSVFHQFFYCTEAAPRPLAFRQERYQAVPFSKPLLDKKKKFFGVEQRNRRGIDVRVTNLERTLVDVLDRPSLAGGWEEVWNSLEMIEHLDFDKVIHYVKLLENATTAAKAGFFLEQHRDEFKVDDKVLKALQKLRPRQPQYMERNNRQSGHFVENWNLFVPENVYNKSWDELA